MRFCNSLSFLKLVFLAFALALGFAVSAKAADYAGAISAYRRAHRLPAVRLDGRLDAVAPKRAQVMVTSVSSACLCSMTS